MHGRCDNWVLESVERYERSLLRFATTLVGPGQARDVVQETFVELCKQRREDIDGHLAAWLFTVTKHRALDLLRKSRRAEPLPEGDDMASPDSGPQIKLERQQALSRLQQLVGELPRREREAVLLKFGGGLNYREIADVMQLSVSNVGFILHTALKTIRAEYVSESIAKESAQ